MTPPGHLVGRREALLGAAALTAAGCSPKGVGVRPGAAEPVNIVTTMGTFASTVQQLMKDRGYLEEMGLKPSFVTVADGTKVIGALVGGTADICTASGISQVLPSIERGGELKVLAGSTVLLLHLIYSRRRDIRTLKDLEGKTIGTGPIGALLHSIVLALLHKNGVDTRKIRFQNVGSSADVFRSVVAGAIDAGPSEVDHMEQAHKQGVHAVAGGTFWDGLPEYTNQASYASVRAIAERRDALVRTLAAYARLYRFISHPGSKDAYVAARERALSKHEPAEALAQWNFFQTHPAFATDLLLSEERVRYMQALNVSLGVQKQILPYDKVTDMSLARDALKLIGESAPA